KRSQLTLMSVASVLFATRLLGQFGAASSQSTGTQATQIPLSGRTGQSGAVTATQSPVAGTTNSVNTINPSVQTSGPYAGSALSTTRMPFSGKLSFKDAIARGLEYNLGTVGLTLAMQQAHGQAQGSRSSLMPNLNSSLSETIQQTNLRAQGVRI